MDEGKFDESIKLLKQARKLDPKRYDYPYKMSYAHYAQGDFKGGINILENSRPQGRYRWPISASWKCL